MDPMKSIILTHLRLINNSIKSVIQSRDFNHVQLIIKSILTTIGSHFVLKCGNNLPKIRLIEVLDHRPTIRNIVTPLIGKTIVGDDVMTIRPLLILMVVTPGRIIVMRTWPEVMEAHKMRHKKRIVKLRELDFVAIIFDSVDEVQN